MRSLFAAHRPGISEVTFAAAAKLSYFSPEPPQGRPDLMRHWTDVLPVFAKIFPLLALLLTNDLRAADDAEPDVKLEEPPRWDKTFNLRLWSGYKDNVLLSNDQPLASPFVAGGLDALLWRLPENDWEILVIGSGEYLRYLPGDQVDKEVTTFAQIQARRAFREVWKAGLSTEYLYFDQLFDNSFFDPQNPVVKVKGHTLTLRPSVRREFASRFFGEVEGMFSRQIYESVVDDEWQLGPKFTLGRTFGRGSEIGLSYQLTDRQFDSREARDAQGNPLPGESLGFFQHEVSAAWRQNWDAAKRWRTITRLGYLRNHDSASGYYDYDRPRFSQQIRYSTATWQVRAEAKLSYYHYDLQTVSETDSALRRKTTVQANFRIERNVLKSLKLFAEYEYEQSLSNIEVDSYRANTVFGGIDWEF